jgi:hypothetical protein
MLTTSDRVQRRLDLPRDIRFARDRARLEAELAQWETDHPDDEAAQALLDATLAAAAEPDHGRIPSEWRENVVTLLRQEVLRPRHFGILVSAVVLGLKRIDAPRADRPEPVTSVYMGTVGGHVDVDAEVTFVRHSEGSYGPTTLIKFRSGDSDVLWWATGDHQVEPGAQVHLVGTVKAHEVDRYTHRPVTVVTRARMEVR